MTFTRSINQCHTSSQADTPTHRPFCLKGVTAPYNIHQDLLTTFAKVSLPLKNNKKKRKRTMTSCLQLATSTCKFLS